MDCNTFEANHGIEIHNHSVLKSKNNEITLLKERIEDYDEKYKCLKICSNLHLEVVKLERETADHIKKSFHGRNLQLLQEGLQKLTADISSSKNIVKQDFPKIPVKSFVSYFELKVETLKKRMEAKKQRIEKQKSELENECEEASSEYQNITAWMRSIICDIKSLMIPSLEDYIQVKLRELNDYPSIVTKYKDQIKMYHSEYLSREKNIVEELI